MAEEENIYANYYQTINIKLRDLEEKNRILKNQMLLLGRNLIETRERNNQNILELKKGVETIKQEIERIGAFLETLSNELPKFARKEDIEILSKQARIFQQFSLAREK